ncbi:MAG: hypothetical protein LBJ40_20040 [Delftia acidovorans]|nr:hypothetical protein [Delftia acidovorans]MDR3015918.1 hypothetical protein [Delftia acidovorans]
MSSMLSPWQAAGALGAAMLALTACDPRSPAVPTPKAVQSVALDAAAPAPAPALTLNFPERTRLPSTAKAGEPGLDSLAEYLGKYPYDGTNYLEQGVLAERLKALLGPSYPTLLSNMRTVGPLTKEGDVWSIIGLRPHQGGEEMGAIVIDPARNALRVWLLTDGKQTDFSDAAGADIAWPEQVNKTMANIEAKPVS